jgi:hypothetical protein
MAAEILAANQGSFGGSKTKIRFNARHTGIITTSLADCLTRLAEILDIGAR